MAYRAAPGRADRRAAAVPVVPLPNDQALMVAAARYGQGDVVGGAEKAAAWRALDRARSGGIEADARPELRRDRLIADVMVGGVLAAAGDSVAGAALAADALATAPCLVPTTPAAGPYAVTLTRLRPNVRCSVLPSSAIVRRGLLFPGGGHAVVGERGRANRAAAVVGLAFGGAIGATVAASQRYSLYKEETSVEGARDRYARAASMRDLAVDSRSAARRSGSPTWGTPSFVRSGILPAFVRSSPSAGAIAVPPLRPGARDEVADRWRQIELVALGLAAAALGCLDLAHTNPFDPATPVAVQVTGPDSAYSFQQIIPFSFTSDPEWAGVVQWKTSNEKLLHSYGDGRFGVVGFAAPPNDSASVVVLLGTHAATHRVVVAQKVAGFTFTCPFRDAPCQFPRGAGNAVVDFEGHDANGFG